MRTTGTARTTTGRGTAALRVPPRIRDPASGARGANGLVTTLMLSFGVPMLLGGDELGRTQRGNNNAYCQDNAISWFDWSSVDGDLLAFTRRVIALRRDHPVFRRRRFLSGVEATELSWFTPAGAPMTSGNWNDVQARAIAILLDGADDPDLSPDGSLLVDDDFLLLVNGWQDVVDFTVPGSAERRWTVELATFGPMDVPAPVVRTGEVLPVGAQSLVVLRSGAVAV